MKKIVRRLARVYSDAECALVHHNALELLVATILSAQCTDNRVNIVTAELFKKYRSAKDFAEADLNVLEQDVRPTGFYRSKSKSIRGEAKLIVVKYVVHV